MIELLGKYGAETIALCALFFTIYQAYVQRKHNILSVQPHLTSFSHQQVENGVGKLHLQLMNNGLGPAYIKSFSIFMDEKPCDYDAAIEHVTKGEECKWFRSTLGSNYAMRVGEIKDLFIVAFPCDGDEDVKKMKERINRLDVKIEYGCAYKKTKHFDTFDS